jgi:hypothetical protein
MRVRLGVVSSDWYHRFSFLSIRWRAGLHVLNVHEPDTVCDHVLGTEMRFSGDSGGFLDKSTEFC